MFAFSTPNRSRYLSALAGVSLTIAAVASSVAPAIAADPFRDRNPRDLNDKAVEGFEAMFKEADYPDAADALSDAVREAPDEPLAYALLAAIDYLEAGGDDLPASFGTYATQTREAGAKLVESDALRGNLYIAVGYFLEAGDIFLREGALRGMPAALSNVQKTFDHLDLASRENSSDPELNAIKGYMDLLLAVALPFADVNPALDRLERYGGPDYISLRGVAVGYRDTDRHTEAMNAVDRAIEAAPDNPELEYLKAQIFVEQRNFAESLDWFDEALEESDRLLPATVRQICRERRKATERAIRDGANVESDLPEVCS